MTLERRLASYGVRDIETGETTGKQTPGQRRRIKHKTGHARARRS